MEAAALGLIDFKKSRILDSRWWRYLRVILGTLERRGKERSVRAAFDFHLALVANGSLTEKSFEGCQDAAKERYFDLLGTIRPWEGKTYAERKASEFRDARQQYIDQTGFDPLDPAFKAYEAQQIERLLAGEFDDNSDDGGEAQVIARMHDRIAKGR